MTESQEPFIGEDGKESASPRSVHNRAAQQTEPAAMVGMWDGSLNQNLTLVAGGGLARITLHGDGRITVRSEVAPDEGAKALIDAMLELGWSGRALALHWRPISTAPKDGTLIDVWARGDRHADVKWGEFELAVDGLVETWLAQDGDGYWVPIVFAADTASVTHWMPIPPAPPEDKP